MSFYAMLIVDVKDPAGYGTYAAGAAKLQPAHEFDVLCAGTAPIPVEGSVPPGKVVLLRFKDQSAFDGWYQSKEYQDVIPLRVKSADTNLFVAFEGIA